MTRRYTAAGTTAMEQAAIRSMRSTAQVPGSAGRKTAMKQSEKKLSGAENMGVQSAPDRFRGGIPGAVMGDESRQESAAQSRTQDLLRRLYAFQICDSTFPIGTFNHSFGMENYLRDGRIRKAPDFRTWIGNYYRSQFLCGEGLLTLLTYRALENGQPDRIPELDDLLTRSTPALETRQGTKRIAKQMLILVRRLHSDIPYLDLYESAIESGRAFGNPAVVFALFAHAEDISAEETFLMYGYSVASTLVQNAVRSVPLGQREGQAILSGIIALLGELYPEAEEMDEEDLGANAPGLELAQILHETQEARLFMS